VLNISPSGLFPGALYVILSISNVVLLTPPSHFICRVPFYYLFKTLFLLYLALPQTQGASYLYLTQLEPTLRAHESQIDAALAQLRARVFAFLQARMRKLWDSIVASATGPQPPPAPEYPSGGSAQAPALSDSVSGPTYILGTLWRTYGPAIVAGGTALLQRQGVTPSNTHVGATATHGYDVGDGPGPVSMPRMKSRASSASSAGGLRERVASGTNIGPGGRFEEIEVPSDAEGERSAGSPTDTAARRSSGWFSWVTAAPTHSKSD
jgi:receptor expression-enhancing protein 1/2/3/4